MSDTQWTGVQADQVNNPNNVAVSMIKQLNPKFIDAGVKFVVQVGDLTENGAVADVDVRAAAAQDLYNAGIGFFPLRGNHESGKAAGARLTNDFPQTQGLGANVFGAANFASPSDKLRGLTYSFDFNNAKFVFIDQFVRLDGTATDANSATLDQVSWLTNAVAATPVGNHNFVFSHKNLIGENHTDVLFGANPSSNPSKQNDFIKGLASADVKYIFSGHDHVHQRSIITSPDKSSQIEEVICGSDSSKFYTPANPSNDKSYDFPAFNFLRETSLAQELYRVTYFDFVILTVFFFTAFLRARMRFDSLLSEAMSLAHLHEDFRLIHISPG